MLVSDIDIVGSPLGPGRARLRARVVLEQCRDSPIELWFDVPGSCAAELSGTGNPWATLLIPLATNLGERLRIPLPVDPLLVEHLTELMEVWRCWYPHLRPVALEVDSVQPPRTAGTRTGAFFSAGVDAWFTLLRHVEGQAQPGHTRIDDLISVWGLDVPLEAPEEFGRMREVEANAAAAFGLEAIEVATNLHETIWWRRADWGHVAHGCALASIALALEPRFSRVLIPSTHRYGHLVPWGSHPMTDPLLGTSRTRIVHDGAGFTRVEKTEYLARSPMALGSLQVCWATRRFCNCGGCTKCYRTMTTLELLGALEKCGRFGRRSIDVGKLAKAYLPEESDVALMREVQDLAEAKGRHDIARAITRSFKHTRRLEVGLRAARWLSDKRFVWRFREPLEKRLLGGSLCE